MTDMKSSNSSPPGRSSWPAQLVWTGRAAGSTFVRDPLPVVVRLLPTFDVARLAADLDAIRSGQEHSPRVIPLRSAGGDPDRTDLGGPAVQGFEATSWAAKAPYLAQVLEELPGPLGSAWLMTLAAGGSSHRCAVVKSGFPWGLCRLHLPILSPPEAVLEIAGRRVHWTEGSLWAGGFWRSHQLCNGSDAETVHLVVDTLVTPELVALFPEPLREQLAGPDTLFLRPPEPPDAELLSILPCAFAIPESFTNWEEPTGFFTEWQGATEAAIVSDQGELVLEVGGQVVFGLEHVASGEFRFRGWSDERTIQLVHSEPPAVVLRARVGAACHELRLPAHRAEQSGPGAAPETASPASDQADQPGRQR